MASAPRADGRPRASVPASILGGWQRALQAPWMAVGTLAATLVIALPLGSVIGMTPDPSALGDLAAFVPGLLGLDATFGLAAQLIDFTSASHRVTAAVIGYIFFWVFLTGGLLDRLARARRIGGAAFSAACGGYAGRFLRLSLVTAPVYVLIFGSLIPAVMDLPDERAGLRWLLRVLLVLLLAVVNLLVDVAKVRTVVEDRRSVLGAMAASVRFVRRRIPRLLALYVAGGLVAWAATGVVFGIAGLLAHLAVLRLPANLVFLLGTLWIRLAWMATVIVFFQGELAHAQYTATPLPTWPDSASVEAIRNLSRHAGDRRDPRSR